MLRFSVIGVVAATMIFTGVSDRAVEADSEIQSVAKLGVYDPTGDYRHANNMALEHVFIPWQAFDPAELRRTAHNAALNGRQMLVTVEPWTKAPDWRSGGDHLFSDILSGGYDDAIRASCSAIAHMEGTVLVRWGHEMEEVTGRYPWARYDNKGYIAAYRYFVASCRTIAPRARFVWSPIGHKPLVRYYPGDGYVDVVGLPVWGYEQADRLWYGRERGLIEAVAEKYQRVARYGKPVIIAELGVVGSEDYEAKWLGSLARVEYAFPLVRSVVYFNMAEPVDWPNGLGRPDWRVSPQKFKQLSGLI
jgi:beta-mannanase